LGHRFLRHVERTRVLLYLVDGSDPDPWATLAAVRHEVAGYAADLAGRPSLVAVNKLDLSEVAARRDEPAPFDVHWGSALTGEGVPELLEALGGAVAAAPPPQAPEIAPPVHRVRQRRAPAEPPVVERHPWGFLVTGDAVERLVARTRFDSDA